MSATNPSTTETPVEPKSHTKVIPKPKTEGPPTPRIKMADGTRRPLIKKQPPPGAKIVPLGVKGAPRVIVKSPASGVDSHPVFTKKQLPGTVAKVHPVGKTVPSVPTVNSPPSSSSSSPSPSPLNKPLASPRAKILPSSLHLKTYPKSSHESSEEECLDHRKRVVETIDEEMKEKEESVNEKSEKEKEEEEEEEEPPELPKRHERSHESTPKEDNLKDDGCEGREEEEEEPPKLPKRRGSTNERVDEESSEKCEEDTTKRSKKAHIKHSSDALTGSTDSEDSSKTSSPRPDKKDSGKSSHKHRQRTPRTYESPDISSASSSTASLPGDQQQQPKKKKVLSHSITDSDTPGPSESPAEGLSKQTERKTRRKKDTVKLSVSSNGNEDERMTSVFAQQVQEKYSNVPPEDITYYWYKEVAGLQSEFVNEAQRKKKNERVEVKEGFLYKQKKSSKEKAVVQVWTKANATGLFFISASRMNTTRANNDIHFTGEMVVEESDVRKCHSDKIYGFGIFKRAGSKKPTVILYATSTSERQEWIEFIRICVKRVSDPTYGIEKAEEKPKENGPDDISSAPYDPENEKALEKIAAINEGQSKTSLNVYDVYEANARAMFSSDTTMTITTVFYRNEAHELITCDVVITKFRVFIYPKSADKPFHVFHLLMVKSISYENGIMTLSIANSNTKKKQLCTVVLYTNSPLSITHNMYNSLKRISPPEQWPELQSPKLTWGEDFVVQSPSSPSLPSDRSAQDGAADPILVYQSQCCLNERPVNQCILDYMAYLVNNGKRELDMTACLYGDITVDDLVCLRDFVAADRYFRSFVLIGGCGVPSGAAGGANAASKSSVAASASAAPAEDVLALMGGAVAGNRRLTRLVLRGLDDEEGNAESFCTAFAGATGAGVSQVCMLDLSGNTLKDGGAKALSHAIRQMQHGLVSLRLAGCGIGSKGFQALFGALKARVDSSIYLRELDISYNKLDDNGTVALCEWVKAFRGGETGLRKLGLAQTKLSFKDLMVLPSELKYLDISGNQITPKEVDNFKMAVAHIPKICAEDFVCHEKAYGALIEMFLSRKKPNKMLNLGRREAKQSSDTTTAGVLVAALETVSPKYLRKLYLSGLAISRDLFERMVSFLVNAGEIETLDISYPHKDYVHGREREWAENIESLLFDCDSLTSLNLSGGYGHKVLSHVIQALCSVSALQNADTTNTNTNNTSNLMVGSPLVGNLPPPSASPVGNASGSGINTSVSVSAAAAAVAAASASVSSTINISLRSLDVSKNDLGDAGAIALAELIRTNNKSLMRIACDKNGFSFAGFLSIVSALDKNETLLMLEANENLAQIIQSLIGTPVMSRMNSITGTLSTLLERNISKTPAENIPRFISKILQDYSCPWVSLFNSSSVGDLSPLKPAPDAPPKIVEVKSGVQTPQQQQQQQQQQPSKK